MVSGRLREHNREQIAQELIEWAKKDDSINLNKFCALRLLAPSKISQWAKEDEFFRQAYETAKAYIGYRREEKLNSDELHVKAYDLNATVYDHFLKEERQNQAKYEADLKAQEQLPYSQDQVEKVDALMDLLAKTQSARKMAVKRVKTDHKS